MDRTDRYTAALDAMLADMAPREREGFLRAELAKWDTLYFNWRCASDAGLVQPADGPDAYDFILPIGVINARLARLQNGGLTS